MLIDAKGVVTSEVSGVQGPVCSTELDKLMSGLGVTKAEVRKPEYAQSHGPIKLNATGSSV